MRTCPGLRDGLVDLERDDFSLMARASDPCRANTYVTGRDLRDLYEAYHVGAVTGITVEGDVTVTSVVEFGLPFELVELEFDWSMADGADEAGHNASYIAVLGQNTSSSNWRYITNMPIRDSSDMVIEGVVVREFVAASSSDAIAETFMVVGVTRGDIQLQSGLERDATFGGLTYAVGDPTYIVGVEEYDSSDAGVNAPEVISASISPRYCWTNDELSVQVKLSGGEAPQVASARGPVASGYTDGLGSDPIKADCAGFAGVRSFWARGTLGSGVNEVRITVPLPVKVRDRPDRVTFAVDLVGSSSCIQGVPFKVRTSSSGGVSPHRLWIGDIAGGILGERQVQCDFPVGTADLDAIVIDALGSGVKWQTSFTTIVGNFPSQHGVLTEPVSDTEATLEWNHVLPSDQRGARSSDPLLSYYYEVRKDGVTEHTDEPIREHYYKFRDSRPTRRTRSACGWWSTKWTRSGLTRR